MPFKAPHVSFVSFAVDVLPNEVHHVMIVETDLHLNPKHAAYNRSAVDQLITVVRTYVQANIEGSVRIQLVSTRSGET